MRAIVCVDSDGGIGKKGKLLFDIPADLQWFKEVTTGGTVIMGRKTYESIGHALPHRKNIIVSRTMRAEDFPDIVICHDIRGIREVAPSDAWVIGGEEIYRTLISYCDTIYEHLIDGQYGADAWFPNLNPQEWCSISYDPLTVTDRSGTTMYKMTMIKRYRYKTDKRQDEMAEILATSYVQESARMESESAGSWMSSMLCSILSDSFIQIDAKSDRTDILNTAVSVIRYGHETWMLTDAKICERDPAHPSSELAFLLYLVSIYGDTKGPLDSIMLRAVKIVATELADNPQVKGILNAANLNDADLFREFFNTFAELGTLYRDAASYTDRKIERYYRLMEIYHRITTYNDK